MNKTTKKTALILQAKASIRVTLFTMTVCCLFYPLAILGLGRLLGPSVVNGSLVRNGQGEIVGSRLIAQRFDTPGYFWPRPSAVDYNASAAGGSNLSPANPKMRARAKTLMVRFNASAHDPIPADLVTASGSGLDPDITLAAAIFQSKRIAEARRLPVKTITKMLEEYAYRPGGFLTPQPLVNVLRVNMALDRMER